MIDGLIKDKIDPLWEAMATPLVKAGWSPNQVTFAGLVLVVLVSLGYVWHGSPLIYGLALGVAFAFDALDGAVARRRDMRSLSGGYFDAVVDRYQELAVLGTLAYVHDVWILALLAFSGSVLTSYAKARAAIEMPVSNENWPDFFERMERVIYLCLVLVLAGLLPAYKDGIVVAGLAGFALLSHATALQRARRAWGMLKVEDQSRK
ncbi:CDP-diacylglycerol--glycerol-3-phosphate 3-phosphatidyltransferase/archaetidylinositol phosphate synthase [Shimia gijangensis]|uniref:CDP-diacylglycerol--glycerol-3-phosphate 3-phosphatidyltransferase/archaetidylinositol phosphate synthase n=1 Tax=Shimia gijangensis TaxID=1470563 RepID=A0A1M6JTH5_9RHOB|nr:CDP-alcohol phosphatidyltransferase family protein [Shimia gijangensis]SHJ49983.1 CDP-diacylglycerol--glycerol-3-phosphate 3-phosphatidyltransferase/archaetidylinositol phosphate synthase [Shimia gijangensis]